jgi:hypothetical protein
MNKFIDQFSRYFFWSPLYFSFSPTDFLVMIFVNPHLVYSLAMFSEQSHILLSFIIAYITSKCVAKPTFLIFVFITESGFLISFVPYNLKVQVLL